MRYSYLVSREAYLVQNPDFSISVRLGRALGRNDNERATTWDCPYILIDPVPSEAGYVKIYD